MSQVITVYCEAELSLICLLQASHRLLADLAAHRLQDSRRLTFDSKKVASWSPIWQTIYSKKVIGCSMI